MTLIKKLSILCRIFALRLGLVKLIWTTTRIPLNDYAIELLESVPLENAGLFDYKKVSDPTGEWRFYIPSFDNDAVYRIDLSYGRKNNKLPKELARVTILNDRLDKKRYKEVWEEGKTIDKRLTESP